MATWRGNGAAALAAQLNQLKAIQSASLAVVQSGGGGGGGGAPSVGSVGGQEQQQQPLTQRFVNINLSAATIQCIVNER